MTTPKNLSLELKEALTSAAEQYVRLGLEAFLGNSLFRERHSQAILGNLSETGTEAKPKATSRTRVNYGQLRDALSFETLLNDHGVSFTIGGNGAQAVAYSPLPAHRERSTKSSKSF